MQRHETRCKPVKSLNWPMTMGFKVTDRTLLDKLTEGKTVEVEAVTSAGQAALTQYQATSPSARSMG